MRWTEAVSAGVHFLPPDAPGFETLDDKAIFSSNLREYAEIIYRLLLAGPPVADAGGGPMEANAGSGVDEVGEIPIDSPEASPYDAVVAEAAKYGLDEAAFMAIVVGQKTWVEFENLGGTPAIAQKRLDSWERRQRAKR